MRRLSLALLAAVNVALLALVAPTSVSADHNEDAFYNVSFPYDKNVFWSFQPGFPNDPKRGAVTNGFDQWDDKVEGRAPNFIKQADQNRISGHGVSLVRPDRPEGRRVTLGARTRV